METTSSHIVVNGRQGLALTFNMFLTKVFGMMTFGLLVTFATAFVLMVLVERNIALKPILTSFFPIALILELFMVILLSFFESRLSLAISGLIFIFYSALTGFTLGIIMIGFNLTGIISAFGATVLTFGLMALFGYITKADLSKIGSLAFMGLIGLIVATTFNLFMYIINPSFANAFEWLLTYAGVAIFLVLTAQDIQKLKGLSKQAESYNLNRFVVLGALTLYLDFIYLFLKFLRIFGKRR